MSPDRIGYDLRDPDCRRGGIQKHRPGKRHTIAGRGMENLPRLNKSVLKITSLDDIEEEKEYWFSKSAHERLEALEINRRMVYGQDRATSRLQRFLETAEHP